MRSNIPYVRAALPAAQEVGDMAGACYCCNHLISTLLALGEALPEIHAETVRSLHFVETMNYPSIADIIMSQQRLVMALQGKTRRYSGIASDGFDEEAFAKRIASSQMSLSKFWYHTRQLQAAYLMEHLDEALEAGEAAQALSWSSPGHVEEAEFYFYQALTLAKACTKAKGSERDVWLQQLVAIRDRFALWASHSAENFAHKHHLIAAEVSRLLGEDLPAMRAYESAIALARQHRFIQDEALSHELAACYYEKTGFQNFADQYYREARRCYLDWGANGKALLLISRYPQIVPTVDLNDHTASMVDIDMASLMRATQSISSEIVPARLSETLMRLLVEASGAERGFLLLLRQGQIFLEASAHTSTDALTVEVLNSVLLQDFTQIPHTIINFVQRSQQKVVLADSRELHAFLHDEYLRDQKPRSLLCVPIVKHRSLVGLIYLENRQIGGTFTVDKLTALEILASQAAISIENARLYADLGREEEKLRTTIQSMADGLIVTDRDARITLINGAALQMVGLNSNLDPILQNRAQMAKGLEYRDADDNPVPFEQLPLSRALHGESTHQVEYHIRHLISGRLIIIRLSASPLRNQAGQIQGAVVVFRDVTELTELEQLKDEFLRAMAHELKTPLLVVGGYFEMF
jgi:PAS domain S-box-containing protein